MGVFGGLLSLRFDISSPSIVQSCKAPKQSSSKPAVVENPGHAVMLTQTSVPLIFSTLEFLFGDKSLLDRPKILQTSFLNITDGKYMRLD